MQNETDEGPELALSDPPTREAIRIMLAADCTAPEIRACIRAWNERKAAA